MGNVERGRETVPAPRTELHPLEPKPKEAGSSIANLLPHRPVEEAVAPTRQSWKRYLLPLLLVSMAVLLNLLALLKPPDLTVIPQSDQPVAEMTVEDKVRVAAGLIQRADVNYTEGFSGWNDEDQLRMAYGDYAEAWQLLTGLTWPMGRTSNDLILDTVQSRSLRAHLAYRLQELDEELNDTSWTGAVTDVVRNALPESLE